MQIALEIIGKVLVHVGSVQYSRWPRAACRLLVFCLLWSIEEQQCPGTKFNSTGALLRVIGWWRDEVAHGTQ